jgi:hypothetical protein
MNIVNYENKRSPGNLMIATIPSDIIEESVLKVFLRDLNVFKSLYINESGRSGNDRWKKLNSVEKSEFISKYLEVKLNDQLLTNDWIHTQHEKEYHQGYYSYIDMEAIERGFYTLDIQVDLSRLNEIQLLKIDTSRTRLASIPFYYSGL